MAKKKITKEELKSPDAFLSFADEVGKFLQDNWKAFAAGFSVLILGGIGMTTMNAVNSAKEEAASESIFQSEKKIYDIQSEHAKKIANTEKEKAEGLKEKANNVDKLNYDEDLKASINEAMAVINDHSGTQTAQMARIRIAGLMLEYKKHQEAVEALKPLLSQASKGSTTYGLARTQLAAAYSHMGEIDQSIQLLQEVVSEKSLGFMHSEVLLKLGVLNREKGDTNTAEEMFRRVATEFGKTAAGQTAKNYLKLIQVLSPSPSPETKASTTEVQ